MLSVDAYYFIAHCVGNVGERIYLPVGTLSVGGAGHPCVNICLSFSFIFAERFNFREGIWGHIIADNYCNQMKRIKRRTVIDTVKAVDRQLEIEKFGKLISTRPTRIAKSKKKYNRKSAKRQFQQVLGR